MSELSEIGREARWYAENNFAIFPLQGRGKSPATAHGLNDWTDNPDDVESYWRDHPKANIGIACGTPSGGLLVFDFDVDEEKDKDGLSTLNEWEKVHGELPETVVAITGSGGMHYLYHTDRTNIHPSANPELGVDIRCDGSYIVAPPSVHPNGRRYEWQDSPHDMPIFTANGAVYDFLDYVQRNGGVDEDGKKPNGKFSLPEVIEKGKRDNVLYRYACHLRAIGRSDDEITLAVSGANATRCKPPMDATDIERICKSACRYDQGESTDNLPYVSRPGASTVFRTPNGRILHNKLGSLIIDRNHARLIDGAPAVWTGERWEFGARAINRSILAYADDANKNVKAEVNSYIMDKAPQVTSDESFDGRVYIQFANGTYDVLSGQMVTPTPEMLVFGQIPVELDVDIAPNAADAFIRSISDGDAPTETVLSEVIGACMCCSRVISESPMLIGRARTSGGEASNGKSTYLNALRSMLGAGNYSSMDIATLGQRFQAGHIVGKHANLGDDIPDGFLRGEELSTFKKLVTGDAIFTDVKNGEGFEFRPSATMVFSMNSVPRLADVTDGIFRRLAFVPFRRRFSPLDSDFDPNIIRKITTRASLQRFVVIGLMQLPDLIGRGTLTRIPDMDTEVDEVKRANDSVANWCFEESIEQDDIAGKTPKEVYQRYAEWCKGGGARNPFSQTVFTKKMCSQSFVTHCYTCGVKNSPQMLKTLTTEPIRSTISGKLIRVFKFIE